MSRVTTSPEQGKFFACPNRVKIVKGSIFCVGPHGRLSSSLFNSIFSNVVAISCLKKLITRLLDLTRRCFHSHSNDEHASNPESV